MSQQPSGSAPGGSRSSSSLPESPQSSTSTPGRGEPGPAGRALVVVSWDVTALRGSRTLVAATLRELAPDIASLQGVPSLLRWRSALAALARESGLLYACGGRPSATAAVFAATRVDVRRTEELALAGPRSLPRAGVALAAVRVAGVGTSGTRDLAVLSVVSADPDGGPVGVALRDSGVRDAVVGTDAGRLVAVGSVLLVAERRPVIPGMPPGAAGPVVAELAP